jgi:hypothetical protein
VRFKKYINEVTIKDGPEAIEFIKKNCKPYLKD